ncbi:16S rRNA (cytosine(967)-C(5))-methyltransferase RsmB [Thermaerobacter marianensis]|uniref:16S rRNA (cytosine(967)-C(5))-methyltransferase RsmB n=1 Tax=Thermaerobacter marianensis TaxID=73919 RepID=UPI0002DBA702|nr:16S rRNA (cytosine(967)-C(5))-methyltransferase RsmB [Thermaerobacter marianensis]
MSANPAAAGPGDRLPGGTNRVVPGGRAAPGGAGAPHGRSGRAAGRGTASRGRGGESTRAPHGRGGKARGWDRGSTRTPGAAATGREAAFLALLAADTGPVYVDHALARILDRAALPARERALATELAYGVARRQGTLDWALSRFSRKPPARLDPPVRAALRLGAYQLWYLDRIPAHAAVDESVNLVRRHGPAYAAGFVNAVLRAAARHGFPQGEVPPRERDLAGHLALVHAHPRWLVERWLGRLGPEEAERLLEANNRVPPLSARVNRLRADPRALAAALAARGVAVEAGRFLPEALRLGHGVHPAELDAFQEGALTWQDESSMLAVHVLDPRPGDLVVDVAAAPGGKSTHIAERMGDRGRVVACDADPGRLEKVGEAARRLGLGCIEPLALDGRKLPERLAGQADRVLADVPCSGLGVLARRPDLRWRKTPDDLAALAELQGELLRAAAACLKPGGVLVYSTCTTEPEENQQVVEGFLAQAGGAFTADDLRPWLPAALRDEPGTAQGWIQLWPHRHGVDGFFIARLRRVR